MLRCWMYKTQLSAYLDGCLPARRMERMEHHLEAERCPDCREQLEQLSAVGTMLRHLPAPAVPANLEFQVRLRLSQERRRRQQPHWTWRCGNWLAPFALPGAAGVLAALLIFASFVSLFGPTVRADSPDVPLALRTPPRLLSGGGPIQLNPRMENMIVELLIDHEGRVADYHIVDGSYTSEDIRTLRNLLLFAIFDPATLFGKPTPSTVVLPLREVDASS